MGFGFKYHLVTVAAIFFALTVGLVVGSLLLSPKVADQQARQIKTLQKMLQDDVITNRAQKETDEKAIAALAPIAIKGRLSGATVAVLQTGSYPDATSSVREALSAADAVVVSVTTIDREMDRSDEVLVPALVALNKADGRFPTDRAALASQIASIIAHGDSEPSLEPDLDRENYMHGDSSLPYKLGARYCVVVAGTQTDVSQRVVNVDQPLIQALQKLGVTVLMCEPRDAHVSDVDEYRRLGLILTTVDNIDEVTGRCSLVFALGGELGSYGVKPTATSLFPPELSRYGSH